MEGAMAKAERSLISVEAAFRALADRTRLRILALLRCGEICVRHVHESLGISQPKASRHLAYLRRTGLVETRRQGLWVYYRLAAPMDPLLRTLFSTTQHCLEHLPSSARDRERLQQRTACCVPGDTDEPPVLACCASTASERHRRRNLMDRVGFARGKRSRLPVQGQDGNTREGQ